MYSDKFCFVILVIISAVCQAQHRQSTAINFRQSSHNENSVQFSFEKSMGSESTMRIEGDNSVRRRNTMTLENTVGDKHPANRRNSVRFENSIGRDNSINVENSRGTGNSDISIRTNSRRPGNFRLDNRMQNSLPRRGPVPIEGSMGPGNLLWLGDPMRRREGFTPPDISVRIGPHSVPLSAVRPPSERSVSVRPPPQSVPGRPSSEQSAAIISTLERSESQRRPPSERHSPVRSRMRPSPIGQPPARPMQDRAQLNRSPTDGPIGSQPVIPPFFGSPPIGFPPFPLPPGRSPSAVQMPGRETTARFPPQGQISVQSPGVRSQQDRSPTSRPPQVRPPDVKSQTNRPPPSRPPRIEAPHSRSPPLRPPPRSASPVPPPFPHLLVPSSQGRILPAQNRQRDSTPSGRFAPERTPTESTHRPSRVPPSRLVPRPAPLNVFGPGPYPPELSYTRTLPERFAPERTPLDPPTFAPVRPPPPRSHPIRNPALRSSPARSSQRQTQSIQSIKDHPPTSGILPKVSTSEVIAKPIKSSKRQSSETLCDICKEKRAWLCVEIYCYSHGKRKLSDQFVGGLSTKSYSKGGRCDLRCQLCSVCDWINDRHCLENYCSSGFSSRTTAAGGKSNKISTRSAGPFRKTFKQKAENDKSTPKRGTSANSVEKKSNKGNPVRKTEPRVRPPQQRRVPGNGPFPGGDFIPRDRGMFGVGFGFGPFGPRL